MQKKQLPPLHPDNKNPEAPDAATVAAVRRLIPDWDGENLAAVIQRLRNERRSLDEIHAMSWFDVRMAFATRPILNLSETQPTNTREFSVMSFGNGYAPSTLANEIGISDDTLHTYAKSAGVKTPDVGQRNHRYSAADRLAIAQVIIKLNRASAATIVRCKALLANQN